MFDNIVAEILVERQVAGGQWPQALEHELRRFWIGEGISVESIEKSLLDIQKKGEAQQEAELAELVVWARLMKKTAAGKV